jgi:membrane-bound serine protease (ClpP class)
MTLRPILTRRALGAALVLAGLLVGLASSFASAHSGHGTVEILEVDGVIDRSVAGYLVGAIEQAQSGHVEAVVIQLNSPGALKADMAGVLRAVAASRVPVVAWVPPGGTAAGGAHAIAEAAHVLAGSPGARFGPALPLDLVDGAAEGPSLLVVPEGVTPERLEALGIGSDVRVVGEREAVEAELVAFTAPTLPDVLRELDGREVRVAVLGPQTLEVDPVDADVRFENMGLGRRVLHAVASPALAYLLVVGGALALLFELYQPGFGVAGISGLALLGLGAYGLTVLPVSWLGALLLAAGLLLLSVDLSIAGFGPLTAGGALSFAAGSVLLFDGPPALRLSGWLIAFAVVSVVVFFVIVMTVVLRAQAGQAQEGAETVLGKRAVVRSILNPEGHVFVDGALWRARAPEGSGKVKTGTLVRVVGLDDRLTLEVELEPEPEPAAAD